LAAVCLLLAACQHEPAQRDATADAPPAAAPTPDAISTAHMAFGPEISSEDFAAHVRVLASDDFGGRAPGSEGETKTLAYLKAQFERLGLKPGNGDSYFQPVPMVETTADPATTMMLSVQGKPRSLAFGGDMVVGTRTGEREVALDASRMVFVGYGVNAPEQGWNDYAGLDAKGKTVVILVNDPGFHAGDESLFEGRRMTYYGRWTYKYEEAARQGAAAALIIHDTAGAGYGWDVVKNSWSGAQFDLPAKGDPEPRLPIQGWLSADSAAKLFADAGMDLEALRKAANRRGFKPVPLPATASVALRSSVRDAVSHNAVAILPGNERPDEAIVYTAHWDHLGTHAEEAGDNIYNGAIDNATGVAGVLEIAEAYTVQKPAPARSIVFLMVTLEESGLLGSLYYAKNPVLPLAKTVAVINLDAMPVVGPTRDLVVIGLGNSELDDRLKPIAERQGRVLTAESEPEKGYFFRSDHFSFARYGVPALYAKGGVDHVEKGSEYGLSVQRAYTSTNYHKGADNYDPSWDLRGVVQDLEALYHVGRRLSLDDSWPNYREGNAFKAIRDRSRAAAE
jgi:Zn-dependent M28 family amino/carboxypeptidase